MLASQPVPVKRASGFEQGIRWLVRNALVVALIVQALLLFSKLDLLPYWADESFTLRVAPQPLTRIPAILDRDIHPPLYYVLLHFWMKLPLLGTPIARARAMSALCLLLATVAVDRLWLRSADPWFRGCFLALWTFSPCLLLYGRMARSYSMQLLVGIPAVYAACRLFDDPKDRRWIVLFAAAGTLLLYTHYVPGIAIPAALGLAVVFETRRIRRAGLMRATLAAFALMVIGYSPWLFSLVKAVLRWENKSALYAAPGGVLLEQPLKLAQWAISFCFGETFPGWGLSFALLLAPLLLVAGWGAWKPAETWVQITAFTGAIAYVGVSRWVSFPFVPSRLLFLYPFFLLLLTRALFGSRKPAILWRRCVLAALFVLWTGGIWAYFHREDFLNKGFNLPIEQMAAVINQAGITSDELIIMDTCNSDSSSFAGLLRNHAAIMYMGNPGSVEPIRQAAQRSRTIWYWRNTHDLCPGSLNLEMEAELKTGFETKRYLFLPYGWPERLFIRLMRWPEQPTHFYQLLEMRRKN